MDALTRRPMSIARRKVGNTSRTCNDKPTASAPRTRRDSGSDADSSSVPGDDEAGLIYGAMERTFRAQVELLNATADRRLRGFEEGNGNDEDDGLEGELGRLEEAERTMREELANAVSDFGLCASSSLPPPTADLEVAEQGVGATAASVDAKELAAAMDDLCRWLQEGDEYVRPYLKRPSPHGNRLEDAEPRAGSASNRDLDAVASPMTSQTRSDTLEAAERRIPLDDLCQWLRDSDKYLNPRPRALSDGKDCGGTDEQKIIRSDSDRENRSSLENKLVAEDEKTPHTFHLRHGRASSLIVLGAAGHLVRAPKGRSSLR